MPNILVDDVEIDFPYEPYGVQLTYMAKVIQCLKDGQNGMLESPTGTGKTLCLLCSVLAWVRKSWVSTNEPPDQGQAEQNESSPKRLKISAPKDYKIPLVIYVSRTHSQIRQVMQEMKKTSYNLMKAVALGSRDQLCINPTVQLESCSFSKNIACDSLVLKGHCKFYKQNLKEHLNDRESILDIEDLVKIGKRVSACPYFASKDLASSADVIFMPYNYLFDPKIRKSVGIPLRDAIVIVDEAHNIDQVCQDAASVDLRSSEITAHINNLAMVTEPHLTSTQLKNSLRTDTREHLLCFKTMLIELNSAIANVEVKLKGTGKVFGGAFIFQLLKAAQITKENFSEISIAMEKTLSLLKAVLETQDAELQTDSCSEPEKKEAKRMNMYIHNATRSLTIFHDNLVTIFNKRNFNIETEVDRCFRVYVEFEKFNGVATDTKVVHFWCFNPGHGMAQLLDLGIHSMILTSGTLTPFEPLQAELNMPVSIFLANEHVVEKSQVCVKAIRNGPDNRNLISTYHNRSEAAYLDSIGLTVLKICPTIPDGLLVFFPSYLVMNTCIQHWRDSKVWDDINRIKTIFVEPREQDALAETMAAYYENIQDPNKKGACFMAVCRGKVSEGLDFADKNGRAVIVTGLPFPPIKDMKVILKKEYLDKNRSRKNLLPSSDQWYVWQAMRAVNQAIGRVIRHRNDYGAILLCDSRFTSIQQRLHLSEWVQDCMEIPKYGSSFESHIKEISDFFDTASKKHIKEETGAVKTEDMGPTTSNAAIILKKEERTCSEIGSFSKNVTPIIDPVGNTNTFDEDSKEQLMSEIDCSGSSGAEYSSDATTSYDEYFEELSDADMSAIVDQLQEANRISERNRV